MCGRLALTASGEELAEAFGLDEAPRLEARYNIAPTQPMLVVRRPRGGRRYASTLRWGLSRRGFPPGPGDSGLDYGNGEREASDKDVRGLLINARAETVTSKPSFREAFRQRRCLIPASGFYEWKRTRGRSEPFFIRFSSGAIFALAGIWEPPPEAEPGGPGACVILTTEPNALLLPLHDRMPVILPPEAYQEWLEEDAQPSRLRGLLRPFPNDAMLALPVGTAVNNTRHEGPACLDPPGPPERAQGSLFPDEPGTS